MRTGGVRARKRECVGREAATILLCRPALGPTQQAGRSLPVSQNTALTVARPLGIIAEQTHRARSSSVMTRVPGPGCGALREPLAQRPDTRVRR